MSRPSCPFRRFVVGPRHASPSPHGRACEESVMFSSFLFFLLFRAAVSPPAPAVPMTQPRFVFRASGLSCISRFGFVLYLVLRICFVFRISYFVLRLLPGTSFSLFGTHFSSPRTLFGPLRDLLWTPKGPRFSPHATYNLLQTLPLCFSAKLFAPAPLLSAGLPHEPTSPPRYNATQSFTEPTL